MSKQKKPTNRRRSTPNKDAKIKRETQRKDKPTTCDNCGAIIRELHCRFVCPICGTMRDCSDP